MGREPSYGITGPYPDRGVWRVVRPIEGKRRSCSFPTREAALVYIEELRAGAAEEAAEHLTVAEAVEAYDQHMTHEKRLRPRSVAETKRRLGVFFPDQGVELRRLTPARMASRYVELSGKVAVDTHRNTLMEVRTFLRWCVDRRWIATSPAEGLKGVGRRRRGKPQLRVDEALRWDGVAYELAVRGGPDSGGALAALLALYCSLRAGEIMGLQVRDLDAGGEFLVVAEAKTEAGRRTVEVPEHLQYLLVSHAGRRPGFELLFGDHHRAWVWHQVTKICRFADVPRVGPHSMRGLHASLSMARGSTSHEVARTLGHSRPSVTLAHYAQREAVAAGQQRAVLQLLRGGRK